MTAGASVCGRRPREPAQRRWGRTGCRGRWRWGRRCRSGDRSTRGIGVAEVSEPALACELLRRALVVVRRRSTGGAAELQRAALHLSAVQAARIHTLLSIGRSAPRSLIGVRDQPTGIRSAFHRGRAGLRGWRVRASDVGRPGSPTLRAALCRLPRRPGSSATHGAIGHACTSALRGSASHGRQRARAARASATWRRRVRL